MKICIAINAKIPAYLYGGTERVVIWLGRELARLGHKITYIAQPGSTCDFANIIFLDQAKSLDEQIPKDTDIVHLHSTFKWPENFKACMTIHGNTRDPVIYHPNTIFVSENHAKRHNAKAFVWSGLDPLEYGKPDLKSNRNIFVFLGKAAWKVKNLKGAVKIARKAGSPLHVLGGVRFNFNMGIKFTFDLNTKFHGMVGGHKKLNFLRQSKGLIFPVLWDEPFGLAIIESLYFGSPIFGTPYGSLPELVKEEIGFLSNSKSELTEAAFQADNYDRKLIHNWWKENFTANVMAKKYLRYYEQILSGENLHNGPIKTPSTRTKELLNWLP